MNIHSPEANVTPPAALTRKEKASYGAGEVASNLAWNMVTGFLLVYYSDVALLPVATLGTLMLVTRVLDAFFDPMMGLLIDKTHTTLGKARPYLLWGPIPFAVLTIATFSVPEGLQAGTKLIYAYATFTALGLLYSVVFIPYSAMLPMLTRNRHEKTQLGSFRAMGASIASIFVYSLTMPIVHFFGSGLNQRGFTLAAVVMGAVSAGLYLVVFANCRERYSAPQPKTKLPVATAISQMFRNPIWRIVFFLALLLFLKAGTMVTGMAYFTKDVLGLPWMVSVMLPILSVAILVGGFMAGFYFKHYGKRSGNIVSATVSIVIVALMPLVQDRPAPFLALFFLSNILGGLQSTTIFVLIADAVELHEKRFGHGAEGLLVSSISVGTKIGMAIGAALTGYILAIAGYTPGGITPAVVISLTWFFYGSQILLMFGQIICISFYRFDAEDRRPGILK